MKWMGFGLLTAAATGAGSLAAGYPFLTTYFAYAEVPLIGKMPVASALLFDIGVFTLVVGATVLMLIALAHQSIRHRRSEKTQSEQAEQAVLVKQGEGH